MSIRLATCVCSVYVVPRTVSSSADPMVTTCNTFSALAIDLLSPISPADSCLTRIIREAFLKQIVKHE